MARVHDLGGSRDQFGPIRVEPDEPVFHTRWEARTFAVGMLVGAVLDRNTDAFRYYMEQLPPAAYFAGYYQRWLGGVEARLVALGVLGAGELDAKLAGRAPASVGTRGPGRVRAWIMNRVAARSLGRQPWWLRPLYFRVQRYDRRAPAAARFGAGDRVVVRAAPDGGHTRRPGYTWGKTGTVVAGHGAMVFPDARAERRREPAQYLYTIAFAARELWGADADPAATVHVDLFESYLEAAR